MRQRLSIRILAPLLLLVFTALSAQQAAEPSAPAGLLAKDRLQSLRVRIQKSRAKHNWQSALEAAKEQAQFLNDYPRALLELANADLQAGKIDDALRIVRQFVAMGQWSDRLLSSPDFAALRANAAYSEIQRTMKGNRAPVSRASTAFTLTDTNLLPEDIDYDPGSKRFLITSVREMKVVAVDVAGHAQDFAKAPDAWPMMAIRVDGEHNMVWATEAALEGFTFVPKSDWGRSAVLSFDLKTGKQLRRLEAPRGAALGDMALLANGDVIVSDGQAGAVYRLAASGSALEPRIDAGDFISPQTPALYPDGAHVFVPDYLRGIAVLDLTTKRVRWLSTKKGSSLSAASTALYFSGGRLIAVAERSRFARARSCLHSLIHR